MKRLRRLAGRLKRFILGRRVGDRTIPRLVIHAVLPSGDHMVVTSLRRSAALLANAGTAFVSDLGGARATAGVHAALAGRRVRRPIRAAIVSTDRALGSSAVTDPGELTRLRPQTEAALRELIAGIPAARVSVVLDLPAPDRLIGDLISGLVGSGGRLPDRIRPNPALYRDLVERIAAVDGVDEVLLDVDDGSKPAVRARRVLGVAGVDLDPAGAGKPKPRARWTLRGVMAVNAVNPHLDHHERTLVRGAIRTLMSGDPARPPQAIVPCSVRRALDAAVHVSGCGTAGIAELHLHVGIQKTATTTVQAAMSAARDTLRDAGVVYVDRSEMMRLRDLRAWGAYHGTGAAAFESFASQLQATVRRSQRKCEQAGLPSGVVFISNETLVGAIERGPFLERPIRPRVERSLTEILDILQPESCHLSLVTRRQDTLIESLYMWQLHGGESFDFSRFVDGAVRHPEALSYLDLAARLESIPGVDTLHIQPYETIHVDLDAFLNRLLAPMAVTVDFESLSFPRRANPAFSERAMELARVINPQLDSKDEVVKVREFLREMFPIGESHPAAALLSEQDRLQILATQSADNEELFRRWMPQYPADTYSRLDTVEALR